MLLAGPGSLLAGVLVCRSTVVRGVISVHVLRSSFGATRAGSLAFSVHSQRALVSNETHRPRHLRERVAQALLIGC